MVRWVESQIDEGKIIKKSMALKEKNQFTFESLMKHKRAFNTRAGWVNLKEFETQACFQHTRGVGQPDVCSTCAPPPPPPPPPPSLPGKETLPLKVLSVKFFAQSIPITAVRKEELVVLKIPAAPSARGGHWRRGALSCPFFFWVLNPSPSLPSEKTPPHIS